MLMLHFIKGCLSSVQTLAHLPLRNGTSELLVRLRRGNGIITVHCYEHVSFHATKKQLCNTSLHRSDELGVKPPDRK